ncbi:PHB depolymerase family esterase [Bradyrhizobium sp. IC3069]|uniref:extracellular catalytic domain type 1 short-chain-length polyhydroxyalkanoate depolymerase n=1 Tax=unclassified Bradyrhizobium TaxID=2631580 RepID=UPI001CD3425F|nr:MULTISPECIES: PHB depolymerase family esterase [unclassified Bradyrhizobium]MCA1365003.1 PHB depolymerase family esterase [Bradyrhizobium sp. IC4059]MCA1522668.1 PHB depolymerase family esterase [Bradyrhizobium sp. IC3069]
MLRQDMIGEATRLTRAGRLVEATALLQRMLRGGGAPGPNSRNAQPTLEEPTIIDGQANVIEENNGPDVTPAQAHMLRELLDRATQRGGFALRGVTARKPPSPADVVPDGTRFIEGSYSNPAGSRAYKLFIPSRHKDQPLPLIVMLHGCTQSPDDFAAGTRMNFIAEQKSCFVVYPAQRSEANRAKCWNWFRAADQQRGRGEPSIIAGITRQVMRDFPVDKDRVYVGGLSAGAAAAAVMGNTYKDLYAAIGVHSGLACGAATDLPSALVAMRQGGGSNRWAVVGDGPPVPTIVFHGDHDTIVHPNNGDQILEQSVRAMRLQKKIDRGQVPGGHAYTCTILSDASGRGILEHWNIHGAGHSWSGGSPAGSYTDPKGPDATTEMMRFFLGHSLAQRSG